MKKIIFGVSVVLVAVIAYNMMGEKTGPETEATDSDSGIQKTLQGLLPGNKKEESPQLGRHENTQNIVVLNSEPQHVEVEDAIERVELLKDGKDHEGLDFARWTLFSENAKYTAEEKERILERASEILNADQVSMLNRDVLYVGKVPELYETALTTLSKNMNREQTENLIKEILQKRAEPKVRSAVIEFAATKNIYVR
ncbi:MAG: hypothetical protein V4598_08835 [Bdellovibrionota bacterium]